jgi:hypothetical protein
MRAQGRAPGCARAQGVRHRLRFLRRPKRGGAAECTAATGSTPWAAVDEATAFRCKHACKKTATENAVFLPLGDRARAPQGYGGSRRGHGGAAVLGTAASGGVGTKRGQRPGLAFKARAHTCWGAHLRAPRPARARARTRTRHGRDAGAPARHGGDQTVAASYG